ncbi:hypothetical protein FNU76_04190 [Chitinimonas arctica]|uniref:Uncharacterized protein n=1 Tax=Chitinimonas arctica TaxID=2594795 RepID=A0A516SBU5_9NEIS|nr:hypothetical protein [Chitinimonas arctica]QDQ25616.1 hypothetical protein FNU76_04190 [Chitinimonas arctica]
MKKGIYLSIFFAIALPFQSAVWAAPAPRPDAIRPLSRTDFIKIESARFNYYKAGRCPDATIATPCAMLAVRGFSTDLGEVDENWGYISYNTEDVSIFLQNYLIYQYNPRFPQGISVLDPNSGRVLTQSKIISRNQPDLTIDCLGGNHKPYIYGFNGEVTTIPMCVNGIVATRVDKDNKYANQIIYQAEPAPWGSGGMFYVNTYHTQQNRFLNKTPFALGLVSEDAALIQRATAAPDTVQFWPFRLSPDGKELRVNSILTFSRVAPSPIAEFSWSSTGYRKNPRYTDVYYDFSAYITPDGILLNPDGSRKYD